MNWGRGITLVIALFIIGMLAMVYIAFKQTNPLVEKNYYEKELKYQDKIDGINNLNAIATKIKIEQTPEGLSIQLPAEASNNKVVGTIELKKNDKENADVLQNISAASNIISSQKLEKGSYLCRVNWVNGSTPYFHQQNVSIDK